MADNAGFLTPGNFITRLHECGFPKSRPIETRTGVTTNLEIHFLNLSNLKLNTGYFVPFLAPSKLSGHASVSERQLDQVLPDVIDYARSAHGSFVVFLIGGLLKYDENLLYERIGTHQIVVLDRAAMERIAEAPPPALRMKALSDELRRFLGREALSPYIWGRPAIGGRFFGRSQTIQQILKNRLRSYTITGARRIGKTSLLRVIRHSLEEQNKGLLIADLYGGVLNTTEDLTAELLRQLEVRLPERILQKPDIAQLPDLIQTAAQKAGASVAIFIDEIDCVLEWDALENYQFLHAMRRVSFEENCRVFLAGFRRTMGALLDVNSPFYNFTTVQEMKNLQRAEAEEMIKIPLSLLGITPPSDLIHRIYIETTGQPELIQMYCEQLIQAFEEKGEPPSLTELNTRVLEEPNFKRRVFGTFMANTNDLEELVCYLLCRLADGSPPSEFEFGETEIDQLLTRENLRAERDQIYLMLKSLEMNSIIAPITGTNRYRFAVPQFVNYCQGNDLDYFIRRSLNKVKEYPDLQSALLAEDIQTGDKSVLK